MKMKKTIVVIIFALLWALKGEGAVGESLQDVLRAIAENNNELRMNTYQSSQINSQYAAANALPNPSLSYTHQYGNKKELGINGELIASQSFDFPTLYAERSKLAKSKAQSLDFRQAELRRQILLNAQEICLDLILLRKQQALLKERLANAEQLEKLYARRLQTGDANLLETNKISLELLNVRAQVRRNASETAARQKELEVLNGGIPLDFAAGDYEQANELPPFDELYDEVIALDPGLKALRSEQTLAKQALRLSRAQYLPGFEVGYQLNTAAGGERFNGFLIGLSIPLFSNRHKVRQARAERLYSDLKYEDSALRTKNELLSLHQRSLSLQESIREYERLLREQSKLPLLNKALESGRISLIEYFVEIGSFYDSLDSYMLLENEYQKNLARLLKHRL
jgi:outer membrane protein TolC